MCSMTDSEHSLTPMTRTKRRRHFVGCLFIVGACFLAMAAWLLVGRIHWWLGGRIYNGKMSSGQNLDFSGEYMAEIRRARLLTTNMTHPFLPDNLVFSNANVTITQHGRTNMTVVCQSANGKAETNNIVVSGWRWRWGCNRLEYAQTVIGPGLGFGVFPGVWCLSPNGLRASRPIGRRRCALASSARFPSRSRGA